MWIGTNRDRAALALTEDRGYVFLVGTSVTRDSQFFSSFRIEADGSLKHVAASRYGMPDAVGLAIVEP